MREGGAAESPTTVYAGEWRLNLRERLTYYLRKRRDGRSNSGGATVVTEGDNRSDNARRGSSVSGVTVSGGNGLSFSSTAKRASNMSAFSDFFSTLGTLLKNDAIKDGLPAFAKFFASVAGNPSAVNRAAALVQLQLDLLTALPAVEKDLFTAISNELTSIVAGLPK